MILSHPKNSTSFRSVAVCCFIAGFTPLLPWPGNTLLAQGKGGAQAPKESDYYKILTFEPPPGLVLECGGIEMLPKGRVAVSTRRGEIWFVDNAYTDNPAKDAKWTRYAHGLHEVLGLGYKDGWLYATQRGELTKIKDSKGNDHADIFDTVCDEWEVNGDYHEYAFGSRFDKDG